jgi:hypothetical protein
MLMRRGEISGKIILMKMLCLLFNFDARLPCEIRESVVGRKSVEPTFDSDSSAIDICKYLFFVLCILLIISGIEIKPGPSVASESSSSLS